MYSFLCFWVRMQCWSLFLPCFFHREEWNRTPSWNGINTVSTLISWERLVVVTRSEFELFMGWFHNESYRFIHLALRRFPNLSHVMCSECDWLHWKATVVMQRKQGPASPLALLDCGGMCREPGWVCSPRLSQHMKEVFGNSLCGDWMLGPSPVMSRSRPEQSRA